MLAKHVTHRSNFHKKAATKRGRALFAKVPKFKKPDWWLCATFCWCRTQALQLRSWMESKMHFSEIKYCPAIGSNSRKVLYAIAVIFCAMFMRSVSAADPEMTIGIFSSTQPYRLDIGTDAMKKNVPAGWNSWATRLKIMRADGTPGSGVVLEDDEIGIFTENGQWRLDIGTRAMKVNTPDDKNSWATRLKIKRLPGNTGTGAIKYGELIGIFSENGGTRLDLGTDAVKVGTPANWQSWATELKIRRLGNKFAAYGDMPYMAVDEKNLNENILPGLAKRKDIPFVIHLGDAGRPGDNNYNSCDHYFRMKTTADWANILRKPLFFTPGDNDWTDCNKSRKVPWPNDNAILALSDVRYVYYAGPNAAKNNIGFEVSRQFSYPENQRWTFRNMHFVSVHMVGSDNGWIDDDPRRQDEVTARVRANILNLKQAFDFARANQEISAVVVAFHVDPFENGQSDKTPFERCLSSPRYKEFCEALSSNIKGYRKPVLLVHGDTHQHCMDKPAPKDMPNLWRLNAPGDFMEDPKDPKRNDADVVAFDANNSVMPFTVTGLLTGESPDSTCPPAPLNSKPSPNE